MIAAATAPAAMPAMAGVPRPPPLICNGASIGIFEVENREDSENSDVSWNTGLNYYTPLIEFTSSLESVEFLPSPTIMSMDKNYIIKIPEKLSIYSAAPRYLTTLFNSKEIHYSKN